MRGRQTNVMRERGGRRGVRQLVAATTQWSPTMIMASIGATKVQMACDSVAESQQLNNKKNLRKVDQMHINNYLAGIINTLGCSAYYARFPALSLTP